MKKSIFIQILVLVNITFGTGATKNNSYDLELKIHCPVRSIRVGDEIPIVFTIINKGTRDYEFEKSNYDRSGRMLEYKLQARDKNGKIVVDPRENVKLGLMGGINKRNGKYKHMAIFQAYSSLKPLGIDK